MSTTKQLTAMQQYQAALTTMPTGRPPSTADMAALVESGKPAAFIYAFNESDRQYGTDQYPVSGTFRATTTPWLNDISTIPSTWSWTQQDIEGQQYRTTQVNDENTYLQTHVPGQTYSGSVADQIQQRYTKGMWDTGKVFSQDQIDTLTQNWINDDGEFARQRLGGSNPNVMAQYTGSDADLQTLVRNSAGAHDKETLLSTLQSAHGRGTLFVYDYNPALGQIQKNQFVQTNAKPDYMPDGFFFSVPIAFFALQTSSRENVLMPVAIQVDSVNNGYIFTTADGDNAWLLAKLWVASADAQWWFSGSHLFNAHSIDMIFGIAVLNLIEQNQLDEKHPMLVLMSPHIQKVLDINNLVYDATGTTDIYQKDQFCDQFLPTGRIGIYQLVNDLCQNYSFDDQAFDKTMSARGVDATSLPVSCPYRDDGQIWWTAIRNFVGAIVDSTYTDDRAVASDTSLNDWMNLVQQAFNHDGTTRFTWAASKDDLKQAFTNFFPLFRPTYSGQRQHVRELGLRSQRCLRHDICTPHIGSRE